MQLAPVGLMHLDAGGRGMAESGKLSVDAHICGYCEFVTIDAGGPVRLMHLDAGAEGWPKAVCY